MSFVSSYLSAVVLGMWQEEGDVPDFLSIPSHWLWPARSNAISCASFKAKAA